MKQKQLFRWCCMGIVGLGCLAAVTGCRQPRMKMLSKQQFETVYPDETIEVYVGQVAEPRKRIAIIETDHAGYVDNALREQWVRELQEKARRLGANAIEETRILTKRASGYVPDPQTPFESVRPGRADFYFMRATAIRMGEAEPGSLAEARPAAGWVTERLATPPKLPGLREETGTREEAGTSEKVVVPVEAEPADAKPEVVAPQAVEPAEASGTGGLQGQAVE